MQGRKTCVLQYDLEGKFLHKYESIAEASSLTRTDRRGIIRCCSKGKGSSNGYQWRYKEDLPTHGVVRKNIQPVKVKDKLNQYDLQNTLIKTYQSVQEAEKDTGICAQNILKCCKRKRKTAGGYIWSFISSDIFILPEELRQKYATYKIEKYSRKGRFLRSYKTLQDAVQDIRQKSNHSEDRISVSIIRCCEFLQKTAYRFQWRGVLRDEEKSN